MRHLLRSLTLAAVAAAFVTTGGCAPKPIGLRPVDTGAGTLAAARKSPRGPTSYAQFEVNPPGRDVIQVKGEGTLLLDGFGNLEMEMQTERDDRTGALGGGHPLREGTALGEGAHCRGHRRRRTLTFVPQGQPLIVPPSGPLAAIASRHWAVEGDALTLGTKNTWATRPRSAAGAGRRPDRLLKNARWMSDMPDAPCMYGCLR